MKPHRFFLISAITISVLHFALAIPSMAQQPTSSKAATNKILRTPVSQPSPGPLLTSLYSLDFPGGTVESFAQFWKSNGFASDNILMVGRVNAIELPRFTLNLVRLVEIGKSIEFVTKGRVRVEVVENEIGANVWRIAAQADVETEAVKVRGCPARALLSKPGGTEQLEQMLTETDAVMRAMRDRQGQSAQDGDFRIMKQHRIVVATGSPEYVESIASVVAAAEDAVSPVRPSGP